VAGNEETHRSALFTVAPAVSPTAVTIRRSASTVRAGRSVTLSGAVVPAGMAGGPVVIYVKRPGSTRWVYLTTRTAYASGDGAAWQYRYTMKRTLRRGYHRFKAVVPLQAGFLSSTSGVVTVRLR